MIDLIVAELLKLRTTRTAIGLLAGAMLFAIVAVSGAVLSAESSGVDLQSAAGIRRALHVAGAGSGFILVLGIIATAGEFRQGTATETFLITPKRWRVLAAKLMTLSGVGLLFGLIATLVAFLTWRLWLRAEGVSVPLGNDEIWLTTLGTLLAPALNAAIGVGIGALMRNQVSAIIVALVWIYVAENLLVTLVSDVGRWLPGAAGQGLVRAPQDGLLSMGVAGFLLAGYAVVAAILGMWLMQRRDA